MDDSEEVRRRAEELRREREQNADADNARLSAANAELARLKERVDACLQGLSEFDGRWKTRLLQQYGIFELELQGFLGWQRCAVVRWDGRGQFAIENESKGFELEEALSFIQDKVAYWIAHEIHLVERKEERAAVERNKYQQDLDERTENNRAGCVVVLAILGYALWYVFVRR